MKTSIRIIIMKLHEPYLFLALLLGFASTSLAAPSSEDERLTLSGFFKPISQDKKRLGVSSLHYTFSGTVSDTVNMIRLCNATNADCSTCNTSFTIITAGTPIPYSSVGTAYQVPATSVAAYLASQSLPAGSYNIGMYVQSSTANCTGSKCSTDRGSDSNLLCMQATYSGGAVTVLAQSDNGNAILNTAAPATQLSATVNTLGLVTSGAQRKITITNVGTTSASSVTYTPGPAFPIGTSIAPASCGSIAASGTCDLTITPGSTASAAAYDINPTPITLTIAGSNTNTLNPQVSILTYASFYQGGYIFSIDDTTAITGSIGGKVTMAQDYPGAPVWSSDGTSSSTVGYDSIQGIDESSTTSSASPAIATLPSPPTPPPTMVACNGAIDGACNSNNIVTYYNAYRTTGGAAPTPLTYYSAGTCASLTIDSNGSFNCNAAGLSCYTGWFLPSFCELGPDAGAHICPTSPAEQNMADKLPLLLGDGSESGSTCPASISPGRCLSGHYWSSTEYSADPTHIAGFEFFQSGGSYQSADGKSQQYHLRCARALTQ